jgi:uncharacterized protein (TIGR00369 family)
LPTSTSCFLCGEENPLGLKIRFMKTRDRVYTEYLVDERRVGFDGVAHGGILAALLDETMGWAAALAFDRMCVTAEATVRYLKRVPTGTTIVVSARPTSCSRKLCATEGEVRDGNGTLYARATGKFMPLSVEETRWIDSRLVYREGEQSVFNLPDATVEVDQDGDGSSHIQTIENSTVSR